MSIVLEQLTKRYDGHPVVNNVSLEVGDGEFFVLLGSSGSGKTTILSLIAGLTRGDRGRIWLHGRDVTNLPAQQRRVGLVFQNYALFQHMTVGDNIEFGLRVRKVAPAERRRRRDELLELVSLAGLGGRMPQQLSGGQQQRVALARALAHQPDVLLLDEPLGALDAKIRSDLRRTLREIQRQLGIATILVTHDQEEAFELADRLGIMSFGRLLEVGPPKELYRRPQTEFVASFLGTANLLVGQAAPGGVRIGSRFFPLSSDAEHGREAERVQVLFRPEDVSIAPTAEELDCPPLGPAEVEQSTFAGSLERLRLRLPPIAGVRSIAPPIAYGGGSFLVEATRPADLVNSHPLAPGQRVWVGVRGIHVLAHPGLHFLLLTDGSLRAQGAYALGGQMARLAHARVTLLGYGLPEEALMAHLQQAKEQLGSGLAALEVRPVPGVAAEALAREVERQRFDLAIAGLGRPGGTELAEVVLRQGEHHLLLIPRPQPAPEKALICVASGEPGKEDVLFAGRLLRHLGAEATLLAVIPDARRDSAPYKQAEQFLAKGVQSLELLGVPARPEIRVGEVQSEIAAAMKEGGHDLLVLGAPLAHSRSRVLLSGLVGQVVRAAVDWPVLIIRSQYVPAPVMLAEELALAVPTWSFDVGVS